MHNKTSVHSRLYSRNNFLDALCRVYALLISLTQHCNPENSPSVVKLIQCDKSKESQVNPRATKVNPT